MYGASLKRMAGCSVPAGAARLVRPVLLPCQPLAQHNVLYSNHWMLQLAAYLVDGAPVLACWCLRCGRCC